MSLKDLELNAVFEQTDEWWIAYIEELPGTYAAGETIEEAERNLEEAIALTLAANRRLNHETFGRARVAARGKYPYGC